MTEDLQTNERVIRRRPRSRLEPLSVNIRELALEDISDVFELGQKLFTPEKLPTLYRAWDEDEVLQLYTAARETCLVAASSDRIVGFALGRIMEKPRSAWRYGWLLWLGVDRATKRRGIATRLLRQLTSRFIEREARIMLVDTDEHNRQALTFFRKHGFGQEVRHVYLSQNLDAHPEALARREKDEREE
ncbi:MAG: GNAT family N-acetyltransferase [Verrucomicrobia bacterium]|jgi:ribosomal protein S18 acetylase RimI-like enzyme|nr:GNAT family N-acetyltransferase [Verrucomicrobiota bacterium]OQC64082.1 MAG: putative acetyltransferase [Verrucomicrobia bacterium ADurb.Bin006]MDI9381908.1 GNAT family N-acetyltransferase [Verrucomicrobiota bacterium]NMD22284.1 GNAT family N-acetyltransferase [Verrucomicrobiota bacterium]HOA62506.1 GNAT family N-acetyltransferase [Verrucomicrobiota bacterium]